MRVIGDKNQIPEDVFDFMISYLSFSQKLIRSEPGILFSISIVNSKQCFSHTKYCNGTEIMGFINIISMGKINQTFFNNFMKRLKTFVSHFAKLLKKAIPEIPQ